MNNPLKNHGVTGESVGSSDTDLRDGDALSGLCLVTVFRSAYGRSPTVAELRQMTAPLPHPATYNPEALGHVDQ